MDDAGCLFGLAVVGAICYVAYIGYWPWVLGVLVILAILWILDSRATKRRIAESEARKREQAAQALARRREDSFKFINAFPRYLTECCVIDSNIWMNEDYDSFFKLLEVIGRRENFVIDLYGPQFDEISNIKKATSYGEGRNRRSRLAINRVEHLQKQGRMTIKPVTIDAKRGAYADPLLVKLIDAQARAGKPCTFFSDDKELRVRVRQHLLDSGSEVWQIVELDNLIKECDSACKLFVRNGEFATEDWKSISEDNAGGQQLR